MSRRLVYLIGNEQFDPLADSTYYSYDAAGNLDSRKYGTAINPYQTNHVLQFVSRDFSVNMPKGGSLEVNSKNLPIKISNNFTYGFLGMDANNATIEYNCDYDLKN